MALRSLDNALPMATERPKKQAKIAVCSIQKQSETENSVNDENKAPLPPTTADVTIDYISTENLRAFSDPELILQTLVEGLESKDWLKICESLNDTRWLALYHSTLLLPILEKVMLVLVKSMKNPRSALIKTSIMASSDIFKSYGDKLLESTTSDAFDHLLLQLLLKASQDKRFVCEEADRTLNAMAGCITPLPLLHKLWAYGSHTNPRVRAKAAVFISQCVSKMGVEGMEEFGLLTMLQMAVDLLNDRLPEAREAARRIVISIYEAFPENEEEEKAKKESWQSFCQSNLAAIQALAMVKIVSSSP